MLAGVPSVTLTHWVRPLRTRLHGFRSVWPRCSSLRAPARFVVAPCQPARKPHTRARSTEESRLNRRQRNDRSGPFFTGFLPHSRAMGRQIRQKLASLGPFLAFRRPKSDRLLVPGGFHGNPEQVLPTSAALRPKQARATLSGGASGGEFSAVRGRRRCKSGWCRCRRGRGVLARCASRRRG